MSASGHFWPSLPLANSKKPAKLLQKDFEEILSLGVSTNWNVTTSGHVRFRHGARSGLSVARFLVMAHDKQSYLH